MTNGKLTKEIQMTESKCTHCTIWYDAKIIDSFIHVGIDQRLEINAHDVISIHDSTKKSGRNTIRTLMVETDSGTHEFKFWLKGET